LHLKDLSSEDLKKIETLVKGNLKKFNKTKLSTFLTTEFILGLCFATRVLYDRKKGISTRLFGNLLLLLDEARKRDWLNNYEFASLVLRSLSGISEFDELVQAATSWLMERYQEFIKNRNYEGAIDCLYGLKSRQKDLQLSADVVQEMIKQLEKMSDETLAKLCILLEDGNKEFAVKFIGELERRLEEEFKNSLGSSLERGLREITSLLNSGYPPETIKSIIEAERRKGQSWAKDISTEDKAIIIKRIPELGELPRIDPKTHALAFKALDVHDRSHVIKLSRDEFQRLEDAYRAAKRGYFGVRKTEYHMILLLAGITSFFTFILLPEILLKIFTFDYQYIVAIGQEIMQDWTKLFTYSLGRVFLIWLWLWLVRILYVLRRGGEISVLRSIQLMPLIGDGIRKFLPTER
ncbi:MAG: hypothetical protein ACP5KW_11080, partial [Thermoproteota archaeon]